MNSFILHRRTTTNLARYKNTLKTADAESAPIQHQIRVSQNIGTIGLNPLSKPYAALIRDERATIINSNDRVNLNLLTSKALSLAFTD